MGGCERSEKQRVYAGCCAGAADFEKALKDYKDNESYFSFFRCLMWHFISSSSLPGRITRIRKVLPSRGLCLYATMLSSFATKLN